MIPFSDMLKLDVGSVLGTFQMVVENIILRTIKAYKLTINRKQIIQILFTFKLSFKILQQNFLHINLINLILIISRRIFALTAIFNQF